MFIGSAKIITELSLIPENRRAPFPTWEGSFLLINSCFIARDAINIESAVEDFKMGHPSLFEISSLPPTQDVIHRPVRLVGFS